MELLTLARYILEMSLMDYHVIQLSESLVAASALLLASLMKGMDIWVSMAARDNENEVAKVHEYQ